MTDPVNDEALNVTISDDGAIVVHGREVTRLLEITGTTGQLVLEASRA